jgi:hypothetical protein
VRDQRKLILALILLQLLFTVAIALGSNISLKEVKASLILDNISKGLPIEYDSVAIIGDLDIDRLILPKKM